MPDWLAILLWAGAGLWLCALIAMFVGQRLRRAQQMETMEVDLIDLDEPVYRLRMQKMLDTHGIIGSANIRDGKVYPAATDEGKAQFAAHLLSGYAEAIGPQANEEIALLVYRDGVIRPTTLTVGDLRTAAALLKS